MARNKVVTVSTYKGHSVIGDFRELPYKEKYLEKNKQLLDHGVERHSKLMVVRADLRYPLEYDREPSNKDFSATIAAVTRKWSREGCDPGYGARRGQCGSEHPHLHAGFLINASKRQLYKPLLNDLAECWGRQLDISLEEAKKLVWPCDVDKHGKSQKNGIVLKRGSDDFNRCYDEVHRQLSYLAKDDPEDITPDGVRKVFYSQIRDKGRSKR